MQRNQSREIATPRLSRLFRSPGVEWDPQPALRWQTRGGLWSVRLIGNLLWIRSDSLFYWNEPQRVMAAGQEEEGKLQ